MSALPADDEHIPPRLDGADDKSVPWAPVFQPFATFGRLHVPGDSVLRHIRAAEWAERRWPAVGRRVGHLIRYRLAHRWGVFAHQSSSIGAVHFAHPTSVVIGAGVKIEDGVLIYQNVTLGAIDNVEGKYPTIRKGATLFAGATVLGGVEVGENAVVGAQSLVLHDVAAGVTVVGSPARAIATPTGSATQ